MRAILKIAGIIILLVVILAGFWVVANLKDLRDFRPMASGAFSKFMCSCMFVEGRTEEQCLNWSRVIIPSSHYEIDRVKKRVSATALGVTSSVQYMGERFGCTVE